MKGSRKLVPKVPVPSDIEIAQSVTPVPIAEIAKNVGILESELIPYGSTKAKVSLTIEDRLKDRKSGKYVLITGMTPTQFGEGKSTTTMGLVQALGAHLGKTTVATFRQPSQGPTFGIKGGAAGGGYAQCIPMEDFNLHSTGDIHAISAAHNLLAAAIDARMFHEATQKNDALYRRLTTNNDNKREFTGAMIRRLKKLGIDKTDPMALTPEEQARFARLDIDPKTISWRRVVDVSDRFLRQITIGQGPKENGMERVTGYDITVSSEVMAILALSADLKDMRERLGRIVVARSKAGAPVTAEDIGCAGAMTVLMKDAIMPTLMQSLEATPVLVHGGPFANIAQGNNSIIADRIALKLVGEDGFVLTEAGFGADMGMEKFFNIKCRISKLVPSCVAMVATIRAVKAHAGIPATELKKENVAAVRAGSANVKRHVQNIRQFGVPAVVVVNRFTFDTQAEIDALREEVIGAGAFDCVMSDHWAQGGAGAKAAAEAIVKACEQPTQFCLLYPDSMSLREKIQVVCRQIYGAAGVEFLNDTEEKLKQFTEMGFGHFPVCMAKTQYSFSHDPELKNAPSGFVVPIRDVRVNAGAGFVYPLLGEMSTMPGLPTRPAFYGIDIDFDQGDKILGLF